MATWGMGLGAVGYGTLTLLGASISPQEPPVTLAVDLLRLSPGEHRRVVFDEKPIIIWHRTPDQTSRAHDHDAERLRDRLARNANLPLNSSAEDKSRSHGDFLIVSGLCTHHLSCAVIAETGDFEGFFCPCCASHYDLSGRVQKGPAIHNLAVPAYSVASNIVTFYRPEDMPMTDDELENLLRPKSS